MLEQLLYYDFITFYTINYAHSHFLDTLMVLLRDKYFWIPLYFFITTFIFLNYPTKRFWVIVSMVITVFLCDQISASFIKPLINRDRPCQIENLHYAVRLLVPCGAGKSFVSSHACNHFGLSVFLIAMFAHRWRWLIPLGLFWAFLVSYAQVYVGVHFPLDVICGGALGACIGFFVALILKKYTHFNAFQNH